MELSYKGSHEISLIINSQQKIKTIALLGNEVSQKVQEYHSTIPGYAQTPLVSLNALAEKLGVRKIFVKDESYRFGLNAFKSLGASYAVGKLLQENLDLPDEELSYRALCSPRIKDKIRRLTFITATDGNHGKGLAWFASKLGATSVILMPRNSVKARVDAIAEENGEVIVTDLNYDDAVRKANHLAEENGWILVQDTAWARYEKIPAWITQGYTTMSREALEQMQGSGEKLPTHVFLQAGVGSMAGSVLGSLVNRPTELPQVIIVEPKEAACIYRSAKMNDGQAHTVTGNHETMMAGLACGEPNVQTWKILRDYAYGYISCSDSLSARGMKRLAHPLGSDLKIVSGESGAVGIGLLETMMRDTGAAEIKSQLGLNKNSVVLIFNTEGDTDPNNYLRVINS
jgi:diaminopropionate ammonia-lyase